RVTGSTDRLDHRRLLGVLVGLGGVAALVGFDVGSSDVLAALSMAVVAVGYAVAPSIASRYLSDLPARGVVAVALAICAVVYAPIAAFSLPGRALSGEVISSVAGLTVVCTIVAFLVFFALIAEVGPARSTVITYVNPAVAVLLGTTVLGEHFSLGTALGFVLIVAGCFLATARNIRLGEPPDSGGVSGCSRGEPEQVAKGGAPTAS
ncbi:MAG: DMT family transporter, partial [Acidimicrobiales bacterium]